MTIVIPALDPDERLVALAGELKSAGYPILVVDDGSAGEAQPVFGWCEANGCTVLRHPENQGKGGALKTAFRFLIENGEREGVVCADADGQHLPEDILRVAALTAKAPGAVVLGARRFTGSVPWKSRIGNGVTRQVFTLVSGRSLRDTQTGLRGYSADMLGWLCSIPGSRFEYEMNVLLYAAQSGREIREAEIRTVYAAEGHRTSFRPLADGLRVYMPIFCFSMSSILSAMADFGLLMLIYALSGNLFLSAAAARVVSATLNYILNRRFVFGLGHADRVSRSLPRYAALAALVLAVNYLMLRVLVGLGMPLTAAKLLTEAAIWVFSFWTQRKYVFGFKT
jgi:putative flippase GtrA